jgi:TldD protein
MTEISVSQLSDSFCVEGSKVSNASITSVEECGGFLDPPLKEGATYADLKLYIEHGSQVALRATSSDVQVFKRSLGVARVVFGRAWGIHVVEKPTKTSLRDACIHASKLAKTADSTSILDKPIKLADIDQANRRVRHECKVDPLEVEVDQKLGLVKDLEKRAEDRLQKAFGWCEIVYGDIQSDFSLISSEGAYINELTPSVDLLFYVTAKNGEVVESASKFLGYTKGYEVVEELERDQLIHEVSERAMNLASGRRLQSSLRNQEMAIVMDSDCAGAFMHEAVGHTVEADFMLEAGSVFEDNMGEEIATKDLTVIDDATMSGQYGSYFYDDEAVEAKKTCLIEKGNLRSLLHTRETAAELNAQTTASAHGLTHVPRCLMSNIYMEPRDWKQEELIEETRNGVYIEGVVRAQSTPSEGLFVIQPESSTRIRNGKLCETIRGTLVTGRMQNALKSIDGIGNKLTMRATVEKEFNISDGGPPIRVHSLRVQ